MFRLVGILMIIVPIVIVLSVVNGAGLLEAITFVYGFVLVILWIATALFFIIMDGD